MSEFVETRKKLIDSIKERDGKYRALFTNSTILHIIYSTTNVSSNLLMTADYKFLVFSMTGKPFRSLEFFPPRTEAAVETLFQNVSKLQSTEPLFVDFTW